KLKTNKTLYQNYAEYSPKHAIIRVSVETGEKRTVTVPPPGNFGDGALALTADNKKLAFTRETGAFISRGIYVVPLSREMLPTEEPKRITFDNRRIDGLVWTRDGQHLLFTSSRRGRQELWKVAAKPGSAPVRLNIAADEPSELAISADGNRLVYAHQFEDMDIWQTTLQGNHISGSIDLISSTRRDGQPEYSPDGQRIAFESDCSGNEEIWMCNADGSNPVQITHFETAWAGAPRWSPTGEDLAFAANAAGNWDIYLVSSRGDSPCHLMSGNADETWPSWSHDGEWIYYYSNRTGTGQIWKMRASGGPEIQVTKREGSAALNRPTALICTVQMSSVSGPCLCQVSRKSKFHDHRTFPSRRLPPPKDGVYFIEYPFESASGTLSFFDIKTHKRKEVGRLSGPMGWGLSISPDGQRLLHGKEERLGSELMFVENLR
ncbi:MAG: TolB family protein, partial [Bryobacteraceae bacterium]